MPYTPLDSQALYSTAFMSGPLPWAVWTAILSSIDQDGCTALNPEFLARAWRVPIEDIQSAWDIHTNPDPASKNKEHGGRRMIRLDDGRWLVVSHQHYREKYKEDVRKEQLRVAKQRQRAREKGLNTNCQKCGTFVATPGDEICPACACGFDARG